MRAISRITSVFQRLEQALLALFLFVMVSLGVIQVVLRQLNSALLWADPAIRYSVLWLGFIAATVATRKGRHISIDALSRFLGEGAQKISGVVADLTAAIVTAVLGIASICAFIPLDAWILAPARWFLPEPWLDYLVGDDGVAFTITLGSWLEVPVAQWVASLVVPVSFLIMSARFLMRAGAGAMGHEVEHAAEAEEATRAADAESTGEARP